MSEGIKTKTIYLVRHGESLGNKERYSQVADTPLSEAGHQQARVVAERCKHLSFDMLVSSNMLRAQETAGYIASATNKQLIVSELFHEKFTPVSVRNKSLDSDEYKEFVNEIENNYLDPLWALSGAESHIELLERSDKAINFFLESTEENILVVTHGTFMKYLVGRMIFGDVFDPELCRTMQLSFHPSNTGITVCKFENGRWRLITWNDHAHFAE